MNFATIKLDENVSPIHDTKMFTWCAVDSRNIVLLYAAQLNGVLKWVMQPVSFPVSSPPTLGPVSAVANVSILTSQFLYPRLSYVGNNKFAAVLPQTLQSNGVYLGTSRVSVLTRSGDFFVYEKQFDYDITYGRTLPIHVAVSIPNKALVGFQNISSQITQLFDINTGSRQSTQSIGPQAGTSQIATWGRTCFHRRDIEGNPWIVTALPNVTSGYSAYDAAFLSKFDKDTGENDGTLAALAAYVNGSTPFAYALGRGLLGFLPTRGKKFIHLQHSNNGFAVCEITGTGYNQVSILSTTENFMGVGEPQDCTYHDVIWIGDNYFMALATHGKTPQTIVTHDHNLYDLDIYVGKFDEGTNSITQANYFPAHLNLKIYGTRAADSCLHKIDDTNVAIIACLAPADATDAGEARISIAIMST